MRALVVAALLVTACGDATPDTTSKNPTGLALAVTYRGDSVVTLSVSGVATASSRKFGPYVIGVDKVPSGGSIGLVFDAADAGQGMACVSSIESDGTVKDSDCTNFQIVPDTVTRATVQLR